MKTLIKLTLVAVLLCSAFAAQAGMVRGYFRSNGTYVAPYVRTAPNDTVTDNLSYRGFGTIRVPKSSLGGDFGFTAPRTLPAFDDDCLVRPLR